MHSSTTNPTTSSLLLPSHLNTLMFPFFPSSGHWWCTDTRGGRERRVGRRHVPDTDDLDKAECEREAGCRSLREQCGNRASYRFRWEREREKRDKESERGVGERDSEGGSGGKKERVVVMALPHLQTASMRLCWCHIPVFPLHHPTFTHTLSLSISI